LGCIHHLGDTSRPDTLGLGVDHGNVVPAIGAIASKQANPKRRFNRGKLSTKILIDPLAPTRIDEQEVNVRIHALPPWRSPRSLAAAHCANLLQAANESLSNTSAPNPIKGHQPSPPVNISASASRRALFPAAAKLRTSIVLGVAPNCHTAVCFFRLSILAGA